MSNSEDCPRQALDEYYDCSNPETVCHPDDKTAQRGPVSATMPTVNEHGLQGGEHQLVILSHGRRIGARGEDVTVDLGLSQPFTQEAKYREFILIPLIPDRCYRASICSSFRMAPRYQPGGGDDEREWT